MHLSITSLAFIVKLLVLGNYFQLMERSRRNERKYRARSNSRSYNAQVNQRGQLYYGDDPARDGFKFVIGPGDVYLFEAKDMSVKIQGDLQAMLKSMANEDGDCITLSGFEPCVDGGLVLDNIDPDSKPSTRCFCVSSDMRRVKEIVASEPSTVTWVPFTRTLRSYIEGLKSIMAPHMYVLPSCRDVWTMELVLQWAKYVNRFNSEFCCFGNHIDVDYPSIPDHAIKAIGCNAQKALDCMLNSALYGVNDFMSARFGAFDTNYFIGKIGVHFSFALDPFMSKLHCIPNFPRRRGEGSNFEGVWVAPAFAEVFPLDFPFPYEYRLKLDFRLYVGDEVAPWWSFDAHGWQHKSVASSKCDKRN